MLQDATLKELCDLHNAWNVYDECGCDTGAHKNPATVVTFGDYDDYETCEPPLSTICFECCTDDNGEQTEDCASGHKHGATDPLCPTRAILDKITDAR